jgi:hypothetical protein
VHWLYTLVAQIIGTKEKLMLKQFAFTAALCFTTFGVNAFASEVHPAEVLLARGYEIKAGGFFGQFAMLLQKGTSAYICVPRQPFTGDVATESSPHVPSAVK